jgi:aryl-alcohol dehydrogenase-like predicted oxidoreductase
VRTRRIGSGGFEVGAVGLGCMGMSWAYGAAERDDAESVNVIRRAIDLGVTLIDTADVYGPFTNEELVGRALEGRRDEVVLATKCGLVYDPASKRMLNNGKPDHVRSACEASLRRLRTDRIDLYQLHRVDPEVPVEDTWGAMAELVTAGKVRAIGLSEVSVEQIARAQAVFPVTSVQSELSLWTRDRLQDVVPWCLAHGVGFLAFAPLGRGFLTGRFGADARFEDGDFRAGNPRFTPEAVQANQAIVDAVRSAAERAGLTPAQVAIAWVIAQGPQVVPIPGTKRLRYLEENAAAGEVDLSAADIAALERLPAPVGSRY